MEHIPYSRQEITEEDIAAVVDALRSDFLTQGPAVERFEAEFASAHDAAHGVAVCNATAALHIGCMALGVGPGDRVWTSPNSFVASANCALYCGATIDFVDINPHTRNLSTERLTEKLQAAERSGTLPKVVIPVDFAGLPCDLADIRALADRYGFAILEDASHAVGATYRDRAVGSGHADITVFSFHPVKIITTGEGGICLTQSAELAQKLRLLRSHYVTRDPALMANEPEGPWYYEQVGLGYNYRMTDVQAALGSAQLRRLDDLFARREALASRYDSALDGCGYILPPRLNDRHSAHHLYVIEAGDGRTDETRARIFAGLSAAGVRANVHYIPIHTQPYFRHLGFAEGQFPDAERYYRRAITIPLFPAMTHDQQDQVIEALKRLA